MTARYLTYTDAATYLGTTVAALQKKVERGEIPYIKTGPHPQSRVRFDRHDLDAHMRANRIGASA